LDEGGAVPVDVRPGSDVAGATADTGGRLIVRPSEVGAGANFAFTAPVAVLIIACPVRSGSRPDRASRRSIRIGERGAPRP
jgi:cation transport ATPase